jgi:hypothetical protein
LCYYIGLLPGNEFEASIWRCPGDPAYIGTDQERRMRCIVDDCEFMLSRPGKMEERCSKRKVLGFAETKFK